MLSEIAGLWPLVVALVTAGIAWGASRSDVRQLRKDVDTMKTEVKEEIGELEARVRGTETTQSALLTEVRSVSTMMAEVRADIRSLLNKQH